MFIMCQILYIYFYKRYNDLKGSYYSFCFVNDKIKIWRFKLYF